VSARIRPYEPADEQGTLAVWFAAGKATYTFLPTWTTITRAQAESVFRGITSRCELMVAEVDGGIVGFLAMDGSYVDRLYVHPDNQRQGWGKRLLDAARQQWPAGLELHTHQQNHGARSFYEANGFTAVRFGISPAPESAPDVEYHWRP